jgi:predicted dehydrogenase
MKKINCLFVGLGSIGQRHIRNLRKILGENINFYAFRQTKHAPLINKNGKKIKGSIEEKYNIKLINKLDKIYRENIDLVFITNPSSLHIETVLKIKNLKNTYIFIEKPLDSNLKKIKELKYFLKNNNNKIFVGFNLKLHPGYLKLKNIINKDKILGKLNYSIFKYGENLKNFHTYENYKKSYASKTSLGGGVCLTSIHEIDMMLDLFTHSKVVNYHSDNISNLKIDAEDFSISTHKNFFLKKRVLSIIILDFFQANTERYIKLIFEKGEIFLDLHRFYLSITTPKNFKKYRFKNDKNLMYIEEIKIFLNLFKKNKKVPVSFSLENAIKSLEIALKIK